MAADAICISISVLRNPHRTIRRSKGCINCDGVHPCLSKCYLSSLMISIPRETTVPTPTKAPAPFIICSTLLVDLNHCERGSNRIANDRHWPHWGGIWSVEHLAA